MIYFLRFWIVLLSFTYLSSFESISAIEQIADNLRDVPLSHESVHLRTKRQLTSKGKNVEPNSWSGQDLIRDSGVSIWGYSSSSLPAFIPPGGSSGSPGSGFNPNPWGTTGQGYRHSPGSNTGSGYNTNPWDYNPWGTMGSWYNNPWDSASSEESEMGNSHENYIECPFPFSEVGSKCLYANCGSSPLTWEAARQYCKNLTASADLAVFYDTNQYVDALNYIRYEDPTSNCSYWIGGSNLDGSFQWITGGYMPYGTPFWGTNGGNPNPTNVAGQNYAFLSRGDFYRIYNAANNQTQLLNIFPLCQYNPMFNSNYGHPSGNSSSGGSGGSSGGGGGSSVINTVINEPVGSNYNSVQNVSFSNVPVVNITIEDDYSPPTPININVHPPKITYTYYDADTDTYKKGAPKYPYVPTFPHGPTYQTPYKRVGGLPPIHKKTVGSASQVPQPQKPAMPHPQLYARILNTMKHLMAKIEHSPNISGGQLVNEGEKNIH